MQLTESMISNSAFFELLTYWAQIYWFPLWYSVVLILNSVYCKITSVILTSILGATDSKKLNSTMDY